MSFAETYAGALTANLQDDEHHHATGVLRAAAHADKVARDIGSLLHRVKYGNASEQVFAVGTSSLAQLQREWLAIVDKKGRERKWIKIEDVALAHILYTRVATMSLAHYLNGICEACNGTGAKPFGRQLLNKCPVCAGSRRAPIASTPERKLSGYEIKLIEQMIAELEALEAAHAGVASALLRREG